MVVVPIARVEASGERPDSVAAVAGVAGGRAVGPQTGQQHSHGARTVQV